MLKGFPPILCEQPKVLILGSMPSVVSLERQEYYGFKHNRFWKIMHQTFQMPIDTYDEKLQILREHHILLWDVIGECEREGSLDTKIRNVKSNDIEKLIDTHPSLKNVICNGKKSYDLYRSYFSHLSINCTYLPSTSNANRTIKESTLIETWQQSLNNFTR